MINVITGLKAEQIEPIASHIDVNAVGNVKRVVLRSGADWTSAAAQSPYFISDTQETKTTWHPIGT